MRILAISNYFPPYFRGGFEISASIICRSLVDRGHEVDVLTTQDPPSEGDRSDKFAVYRILEDRHGIEGIKRYHPRLHGWAAVNAEFRNGPINRRILSDFLEGRSYDVAILFNLYRVGTSLAHTLAVRRIPTLWSFGDYWHIDRRKVGTSGRLARANRNIWSKAVVASELNVPYEYATFNSEFLRQRYDREGIRAKESWVVHRSCPRQEVLLPYSFSQRKQSFVVTSQIERHKGIHIVLDAAAILSTKSTKQHWTVDIFGSGNSSYLAELTAFVDSNSLGDRIAFHGKMPHSKVLDAVKSSLALVHPAIWDEPFGRVAIEAMACNTPLISADTGAIFEIVDMTSALIYPKESATDLAEAMNAILTDEALGQRLSAAGLETHRQRFTPEVECGRIEGILEHIAQSSAT